MKSKFNRFLSLLLALVMVIGLLPASAFAAGEEDANHVLDSAWEVENQNENLVLNADGSITITTEGGTIGGDPMQNVLYQELPVTADYVFTVKVTGNFTENFQGAYLMITSGKELENAVGVVRRHHGYLGGNYGTNELFGVMQEGTPAEYYTAVPEGLESEFYLRLKKNNGTITGYYAKEYSPIESDWTQIIQGDYVSVTKAGLTAPEKLYIAIGACSGGQNVATDVTFSELTVGGQDVPFAVDPSGLSSIEITGAEQVDVGAATQLNVIGKDYEGNEVALDSVTYKSSDEAVAAVDENGVVTGVANGKATITATATKGSVTKTATFAIQAGYIGVEESWSVESPDGETSITVEMVTGGTLQYHAQQNGFMNIETSPMGLVTNLGDFSKDLVFVKATESEEFYEEYTMLSGKDDLYVNHYNERVITFTNKNDASIEFEVVIRAYDDGTAYKYNVNGTEGTELHITDETSGLQLPDEVTIYWMNYENSGWNYESRYNMTAPDGTTTTPGETTRHQWEVGKRPSLPLTYEKNGVYTLFTEANLNGSYTGSATEVMEGNLLNIEFAPLEKERGGVVETTLPFTSPWRVAITGTPEDIVENTLVENLADAPDPTIDFSWVKPGLSSWSWVSNWGQGSADQKLASTHLNWIEFGAEIGWDYYILDEGWNLNGRGVIPGPEGMRDWWPEVKAAAEEAGVGLWAWVWVGDIRDDAKREALFSYWHDEGIVGIKPDFFDGEDQATIALYDEIYADAAKYELMVLVHGANKPSGEVRTWPNVYGREAIAGQEQGGITSQQYTIVPFTRAAIGPTEVTEELRSKDYNKTTMGWQVAMTVMVEDGIHSMGSAPDVYRSVPEAMTYYTDFPGGWDDTEFVNGVVGEYVSIARLAKGSNDWYCSGITVDPMSMDVPMTFLDADTTYTALLIKENDRRDIDLEVITNITAESTIPVSMLYGGGYAIRLIPEADVSYITEITAPEAVSVGERDKITVEITVGPEDAEFKDVIWTSADETIATVNTSGEIQGLSEGETVVTVASAFNPEVKAEIKVTVTPSPYNYVTIEAESGIDNTGEIRYNNPGTHSGGAYVGGWDNGGSATYIFNSAAAGDVTMEIFGCSAQTRALVVTINGVTLDVPTVSNGSWDATNGSILATVTIPVVEGENIMIVGGPAAANAPNVDCFVLALPKAAAEPAVIASGWSGYTNWTLTDDGVLTFVPSGMLENGQCNMRNYWKVDGILTLPWGEYADQITSVVIEDGIHDIGQMAFYALPNLKSVTFGADVVEIRNYAFKNCTALETINLENVDYIREGAFYGCTALETIELAEDVVIEDWAFTRVPGYVPAN